MRTCNASLVRQAETSGLVSETALIILLFLLSGDVQHRFPQRQEVEPTSNQNRIVIPRLLAKLCASRGARTPDLTVTCGAVTDNPCAGLLQTCSRCVCPAGGSYQQPILCLVGNLSASGGARDATRLLLTWREFRTLLHEMGHAVHSLVSRTRYQHVWGTRYVGQSQVCSQAGQPYSSVGPPCGVRSCAELMLCSAVDYMLITSA
jgi:hypothetical protein